MGHSLPSGRHAGGGVSPSRPWVALDRRCKDYTERTQQTSQISEACVAPPHAARPRSAEHRQDHLPGHEECGRDQIVFDRAMKDKLKVVS